MTSISITVPMDANALGRAADMLHGLAIDCGKEPDRKVDTIDKDLSDIIAGDGMDLDVSNGDLQITSEETTAATAFSEQEHQPVEPATPATPATPAQPATPKQSTVDTVTTPATSTATQTSVPAGVELDADKLPWDVRINPASKAKVKATNKWKLKRNLDPAFVITVQAELRAAMAIPAPIPNEPATPAQPATVAASPTSTPSTPAPVATPAPAQPTAAAGNDLVTTLPQLMAKITAEGITLETVNAAVTKHGLASVALLATRPDLIPGVVVELFG